MTEDKLKHLLALVSKSFPELRNNENLPAYLTHLIVGKQVHLPEISHEVTNFLITASAKYDELVKVDVVAEEALEYRFDFIDLFAGIGGFRIALESTGGNCVFSSEWDKAAQRTYFMNHGEYPFGDINYFTGDHLSNEEMNNMIPDHDILAGGFPCQPFSLAGVSARTSLGIQHGFECKTQGTLFHSIARMAFVKQPRIVFMENVKNIVTHNKGETFKVIRETMETLSNGLQNKHDYVFHFKLINSQSLVPQRRIRCFMVCVRKDIHDQLGQFEFPEIDGPALPLQQALERNLSDAEIEKYTISDALWQGHINRTQRNLDRNTGFTAFEADLNRPSNTIVARYGKDGKECLIPQEGRNPRKLTKRECANLFGYPTDFWIPDSATPAYKQFGNSVVVPVVTRIAESITRYLGIRL